jgi:hypothetical protein
MAGSLELHRVGIQRIDEPIDGQVPGRSHVKESFTAAIVVRSLLAAERSSWVVGVLVGEVVVRLAVCWPVTVVKDYDGRSASEATGSPSAAKSRNQVVKILDERRASIGMRDGADVGRHEC